VKQNTPINQELGNGELIGFKFSPSGDPTWVRLRRDVGNGCYSSVWIRITEDLETALTKLMRVIPPLFIFHVEKDFGYSPVSRSEFSINRSMVDLAKTLSMYAEVRYVTDREDRGLAAFHMGSLITDTPIEPVSPLSEFDELRLLDNTRILEYLQSRESYTISID